MFSLILAALYVGYKVLISNVDAIVAVENTLGFLWYWHITFAVIKCLIWVLIPLFGIFLGTVSNRSEEKAMGLAMILGSPFILVFMALSSALFLGGVYAIDSGLQGGEVVNQRHLVIGCVLYGIGVLTQKFSGGGSSSKSD